MKRILSCGIIAGLGAVLAFGQGTTYYVRADGGSEVECTGLVDAPYSGSGVNQPCAWSHPFYALPPGGPPRIAGGDTLIIGPGSYIMGYGGPGSDEEPCMTDYPWDCHMCAVPSGPDAAHPTRILGAGWDQGCPDPPELWGRERSHQIFDLTDADFVEIGCLDLTDHDACIEGHGAGVGGSTQACDTESYPYGDWADTGIYAQDSTDVTLFDLDIHGFSYAGIHAGRLTDWTLQRVRLAANGWVGWDGDIEGSDSNGGVLLFQNCIVAWNGCGETYPDLEVLGCWSQTAGGYGDGLGTGATAGHWIFDNCSFISNTSDGLDLLYAQGGSEIDIDRVRAQGNAGNPVKVRGPTTITNSIIVSDCTFFQGKPFTFNVDDCRAGGNTLSVTLNPGDDADVINNSLTGEGDCLMEVECATPPCSGSETVTSRNNVFLGQWEFGATGERSCLVWYQGFPHNPMDFDYDIIDDVKDDTCPPGSHNQCSTPPGLVDPTLASFDGHLLAGSPAIDTGDDSVAPSLDFEGTTRPQDGDGNGIAQVDVGAFEFLPESSTMDFATWRSGLGDPGFDPQYDLDGNDFIDVRDMVLFFNAELSVIVQTVREHR